MVIDDKGGEIVHKDSEKTTQRGREIKIQVIGENLRNKDTSDRGRT